MFNRLVNDPRTQAHILQRWPAGRVTMADGQLVQIRCGVIPRRVSVARVWMETKLRSNRHDRCNLHYHSPLFAQYLSLDYVLSSRQTRLATFRGACQMLDEIARLRSAVAIFAHVSTMEISDRLLLRWGWQRHLLSARGRHWVKRFYNGYPVIELERYLAQSAS